MCLFVCRSHFLGNLISLYFPHEIKEAFECSAKAAITHLCAAASAQLGQPLNSADLVVAASPNL